MHGSVLVQEEVRPNRVLDTMRATVRHEMTEAAAACEEKPGNSGCSTRYLTVTYESDTNSELVNIPRRIFSE